MRWSDIMSPATPKMLRQFAGLWLVFFGALACWQGLFLGNATKGVVYAVLGTTLGSLGLLFPGTIGPVYRVSLVLAFPIGWLVSHVILAVVFIGVFIPLALIFRIMGRDVLALKLHREKETYWLPKPPFDASRYFDQF
jgi:hypothetical protein